MRSKLLFAPFVRIAGWRALWPGLALMLFTALVGSRAGVVFDGALDIHFAPNGIAMALAAQCVDFLSLFLSLLLAGAIFSRTKYRLVDVAGAAALGRAPMLAVALLSLLPIVPSYAGDMPKMICFVAIALAASVWMIVLLYNGYSVSFNLDGARGKLSFVGALALAEILSKATLFLMLSVGGTRGAAAAESPSSGTAPERTMQQTAALVVEALQKGDYDAACALFDRTMRGALPAEKLKEEWEKATRRSGALLKADTDAKPALDFPAARVLMVPCTFEKGEMTLRLAFGPDGRISGLYITNGR